LQEEIISDPLKEGDQDLDKKLQENKSKYDKDVKTENERFAGIKKNAQSIYK